METLTIAFYILAIIVFWVIALRFYYRLSLEMSQYAEPPIKSPSTRITILAGYGLGLNLSFVLINILKSTPLSDVFTSFNLF